MSNAAALITAIASLIVSVTGLAAALTKWFRGVSTTGKKAGVSRRTTESMVFCGVGAGVTVGLIELVRAGWAAQNITLTTLLLAAIGVLVLLGTALGVERTWTAWERERLLAVNAALGPIVGVVVWLTALITMSPLWQMQVS